MMKQGLFDSVEYHRAHPDVTSDSYVNARRIELGKVISKKRKIYLDTRFWILLRDVTLGRNDSTDLRNLLEGLREGVNTGVIVCPICETTFFEIFKQEDPITRRATVALVDELSTGVTLADHFERAGTELAYLLHTITGRTNLHDLDDLVWNKLSFVLGIMHPTNALISEKDETIVQKAFFDHLWSLSMRTMEQYLGGKQFPSFDYDGIAENLNLANARHAGECKSFEQLYRNEFIGGLETSMPVAVSVIERWYAQTTGRHEPFNKLVTEYTQNVMLSILSQAIKKNDLCRTLRTAHIGALCHASFRWDQKRKLSGHWLHDFHHAEAAVGYCDVFLTEKPLAALLKQKHLRLDEAFSCEIISSPDEGVRAVSSSQ
jgi:hypothetical protein